MSMIELKDINKTYFGAQPLHVLKGISLSVEEGEFISIMGASGSGKSTLLNILGILDNYDSGEYRIDGQLIRDLSETKAAEYRNRLIGFIFQSFNLISFKTAVENVELPLFYQGVSRKKRHTLAMEYLERLDLAPWAEHYPNEMSGGQKQRVAIARALITQPRLILADEPTGALDSKTSVEVMELLKQLNQEQHKTIIVVTHESGVANETNKIIHIKDGIIGKIEENKDHKASPFGINGIMKSETSSTKYGAQPSATNCAPRSRDLPWRGASSCSSSYSARATDSPTPSRCRWTDTSATRPWWAEASPPSPATD